MLLSAIANHKLKALNILICGEQAKSHKHSPQRKINNLYKQFRSDCLSIPTNAAELNDGEKKGA